MPTSPLSKTAVERHLTALNRQLGEVDQRRLADLIPSIGDDRRISLQTALTSLFPDQPKAAALTAFRQFRQRIAAAATAANIRLDLKADTKTRTEPEHRWCWFTGDDKTLEAAARFVEAETRNVVRIGQTAVQVGKHNVRYFISYAHKDAALKDRLHRLLQGWFGSASAYTFTPWQDPDIQVGKDWHQQIQAAIKACDFGLLLVSPDFLASSYITTQELHHFIAPDPLGPHPGKLAVPVALCALRFDGTMDMKGLEKRQIFRDNGGKAFEERSSDKTRKDFASELFAKIVQLLDSHFEPPPPGPEPKPRHVAWLHDELAREFEHVRFVPPSGRLGTMSKLDDEAPEGERKDAVQFLLEWAREPDGPSCCALLGSVGIGKTTTSKAFALQLLKDREADSTLPMPIYLDLRNLGEAARDEPDLNAILHTVLRRSWQGGTTSLPMEPDEAIRLVRQEGAIVIFDGLDEVLVHLSQRGGQQFTRELLRILPPGLWPRNRKPNEPGRPGRIMITCRTHYFRSLREQQTHLTLEDRDDVRDTDYRTFVLLPFDDAQIADYLRQTFPDRETGPLLETIRAVHNLPELATRPYTLSLIADSLPQIERWQMQGRRVTGVDLYRHMVLSWLERDSGKHEFDIDHKQQIMEYVAAELWRTTGRTWTARQMEDWLADFMERTPSIDRHYRRKDLELLKKDLRTATFLVGGGRRPFRFAHSSLQEFFLAGYLLRALRENRPQDWVLPRPSRETFDFLGQMMLGETDGAALAGLAAMKGVYLAQASEWAFAYVLHATQAGYPSPSPACIVLDGADLRHWTIEAPGDGPLLVLRDARFRGARLDNAMFRHVDLAGADFTGASGLRLEVNGGRAINARFDGAELPGAVFRDLDLSASRWSGTELYRTKFLGCILRDTENLAEGAPQAFFALSQPAAMNSHPPQKSARLALLGGHSSGVRSCAFAPDGKRILSASADNTLKLWDAQSGECIQTFQGHTNSVWSCAFAPDGKRILSASLDNTLKLWDAQSGECIQTFQGHTNWVTSCAFAPDGKRILSASDDNTLKLWDAQSGECIQTFQGHTNWVWSCAFAPDGKRILSASDDNTLKLWDAQSGECIQTFQGHTNWVRSCAFAPDGKRILSASADNTLKLWDAQSGECIQTFQGHTNSVRSCAFAPDGKRILSASADNTLKLWDAQSGECIQTFQGHTNSVWSCAFAPDGKRILSASADNTLKLWDAQSGECIQTFQGHTDSVTSCAFAPDGKRILSASADNTLKLWDAQSGECIQTFQGHTDSVTSCAFAPDGKRILSASYDQTLKLWDAQSGECIQTFQGHTDSVWSCAFAPDGKRILSASDDNTLKLWDAQSGECIQTFQGHTDSVTSCAFAPDGKRILSASADNTLKLWDAQSGECIQTFQAHTNSVTSCAFAPDGKRILSASDDNTLKLWDAQSGECIQTFQGHTNWVWSCAFAPDGKRILSASDDNTLKLWDAQSGECLQTFQAHTNGVMSCAFAPDGKRILSASADNTLKLWDAQSGKPVGLQVVFLASGGSASLAPDASKILYASREAWRDLGWLVADDHGTWETYPAEVFGPLPGSVG